METIRCLQCDKDFRGYGNRKYCSVECNHKSRFGHRSYNSKPTTIKTCIVCRIEFETGGRGRPPKTAKHCSWECSYGKSIMPPPRGLSERDAAYIAGFFDGEGSVIEMKKENRKSGYRVVIYQSQRDVLEWIREVVGTGEIHSNFPSHNNLIKKPVVKEQFHWQIYGKNAANLMKQLLPYLHVKNEKAQVLINAYEN